MTALLTATLAVKLQRTSRTYIIQFSDGRRFARQSSRPKAAIFCPINPDWGTSTSINATQLLKKIGTSGLAGTVVDLATGEILFHRAEYNGPASAAFPFAPASPAATLAALQGRATPVPA